MKIISTFFIKFTFKNKKQTYIDMKKTLLLLAFVSFGIFQANAQCTISPSCTPDPATAFCSTPDPATPLPDGEVGTAYTTVIQVSVGTTASGIPVTSGEITNINLPAGLTYSTNPANGIILAGQSGCIEITGTPTTAGAGGTPEGTATVQVMGHTAGGSIPFDIPYNITITDPASSVAEIAPLNLFSLFPNPATSDLTVKVIKPMEIEIFNVLGTKVVSESIKASKTINIAHLNAGVYFVVDKASGTTQKLIKR